jgi:hypothetical protein
VLRFRSEPQLASVARRRDEVHPSFSAQRFDSELHALELRLGEDLSERHVAALRRRDQDHASNAEVHAVAIERREPHRHFRTLGLDQRDPQILADADQAGFVLAGEDPRLTGFKAGGFPFGARFDVWRRSFPRCRSAQRIRNKQQRKNKSD